MEQKCTLGLEEVAETFQSLSTSPGERVMFESTSVGEKVASERTSADEKVPSESSSEDDKAVSGFTAADEKATPENSAADKKNVSESSEEEECGLCLFMKAGQCGKRFELWLDCVEGAEKLGKDTAAECAQVTSLLMVCMAMNPQHYGPLLDAEKAMQADFETVEETSHSGARFSDPSAQGEEGMDRANEEQSVERAEEVAVVVDDEGQVVGVVDAVEVVVKAV